MKFYSHHSTLTLDGQEWKDRRVKLTPMFTSGKMKMMFEIIDSIGDKLVSVLGKEVTNSSDQEMRNWAQRFTGDNIGNVAFGLECSCELIEHLNLSCGYQNHTQFIVLFNRTHEIIFIRFHRFRQSKFRIYQAWTTSLRNDHVRAD
jgi:cytochrome P450